MSHLRASPAGSRAFHDGFLALARGRDLAWTRAGSGPSCSRVAPWSRPVVDSLISATSLRSRAVAPPGRRSRLPLPEANSRPPRGSKAGRQSPIARRFGRAGVLRVVDELFRARLERVSQLARERSRVALPRGARRRGRERRRRPPGASRAADAREEVSVRRCLERCSSTGSRLRCGRTRGSWRGVVTRRGTRSGRARGRCVPRARSARVVRSRYR